MMSTLFLHVRQLVLAFLLALLVVPLADRLAPAHSNETRAEVSADLDAIVQAHVTSEAKKYNIPAPIHRFVSFRAPGVTMRSTEPDDKDQILIRLGAVMQTPLYAAHPEWVKAVAGHEFGHAVMMERNQAFNQAIQNPEVVASLARQGVDAAKPQTAAQFAAMVQADSARWAKVIKDNRIALD